MSDPTANPPPPPYYPPAAGELYVPPPSTPAPVAPVEPVEPPAPAPAPAPAGPRRSTRGTSSRGADRPRIKPLIAGIAFLLCTFGWIIDGLADDADFGELAPPVVPSRIVEVPADAAWADYLIEPRVGRTCRLETTGDDLLTGVVAVTQRVTRATTSDDETRLTLNTTTRGGLVWLAETAEQDLDLVAGADGTLTTTLPLPSSVLLPLHTDDLIAYPAVARLRAGESTAATVELSVELAGSDREIVEGGATTLRMSATVDVQGVDEARVVTPGGTFDDVVGVRVSLRDISPTNVAEGREAEAGLVAAAVERFVPPTTTWYARGQGPVKVDLETFGIVSEARLVSCTG